jgi:hypothetical protein
MSFIKIVFYLFVLLFSSSALYAESMHFDCKCNYEYIKLKDYTDDTIVETIESNNFCADVHLEIKTDTKQMRVIEEREHNFPVAMDGRTIDETDISFRTKHSKDLMYSILRFDKYTETLTKVYSNNNNSDFKTYSKKVYRCEKVNKKY